MTKEEIENEMDKLKIEGKLLTLSIVLMVIGLFISFFDVVYTICTDNWSYTFLINSIGSFMVITGVSLHQYLVYLNNKRGIKILKHYDQDSLN